MERLRPLSETECYTRLYGRRDPTVTIVSRAPRVAWPTVTVDELREAFEERLAARDPISLDSEAA
ncbi:MAG TPA: hypothetical protein VLJ76_09000 [Gaiellaceae bacterium]|nr:hypothetical protein [Gaiellaceae bacterium]